MQLARVARQLVNADPLPTPARAVERLRNTTPPAAMPSLSDTRLVQLAAAAAGDVAVNAQLQLYPISLAADRALRLAAGSLALARSQTLTIDQLRARAAARFPQAAPLPDRPALDRLLTAAGIAIEWDAQDRVYRPVVAGSRSIFATSTRLATVGALSTAGVDPAEDAQARLAAALDRDAFLAILVTPQHLTTARRALLVRLRLAEVDVTRILVETLRSIGVPWQLVIESDAQPPGAPDRRNLETAVRHEVLPRVAAAVDDQRGPVLITEAAPLARYGCMDLIARLADNAVPRPAARLLLAAARRPTPVLDSEPIPVTSAAQWMWLPEPWYAAR